MSGIIVSRPIREGKVEAFRSFIAELMGSRRGEWAQSKRQRGITHVTVAEAWHDGKPLAILYVVGDDPERAMAALTESEEPFDVWLTQQQSEIFGDRLEVKVVADTSPPSGPWKGAPRKRFNLRMWRGR